MQTESINVNAPHAVFFDNLGQVVFAETSKKYAVLANTIGVFDNFYQAAAYVKALNGKAPTLSATWLIYHEAGLFNGYDTPIYQTQEHLRVPSGLTHSEVKQIFTAVLDLKYPPGLWQFYYWLGLQQNRLI